MAPTAKRHTVWELRAEAAVAGDLEMVRICDAALAGCDSAMATCQTVLDHALAAKGKE